MMIKPILLAGLVLLMAGCSSSDDSKTHYQLPSHVINNSAKSAVTADKQIQLMSVNVADYLNGNGIVYQTSDVQFVMANQNLWGGSLQQQLSNTLAENLNAQLPNWLIANQMMVEGNKNLQVNVTGFHGRYDGKVIIKGEWALYSEGKLFTKTFDIQQEQQEDGYDGLVRALAEGWFKVSNDIAKQINQLNPSSL